MRLILKQERSPREKKEIWFAWATRKNAEQDGKRKEGGKQLVEINRPGTKGRLRERAKDDLS